VSLQALFQGPGIDYTLEEYTTFREKQFEDTGKSVMEKLRSIIDVGTSIL
jgi:hypothetical protein